MLIKLLASQLRSSVRLGVACQRAQIRRFERILKNVWDDQRSYPERWLRLADLRRLRQTSAGRFVAAGARSWSRNRMPGALDRAIRTIISFVLIETYEEASDSWFGAGPVT